MAIADGGWTGSGDSGSGLYTNAWFFIYMLFNALQYLPIMHPLWASTELGRMVMKLYSGVMKWERKEETISLLGVESDE